MCRVLQVSRSGFYRELAFALQMEVGMTHVNDQPVNDLANCPFGVEKSSGQSAASAAIGSWRNLRPLRGSPCSTSGGNFRFEHEPKLDHSMIGRSYRGNPCSL